MIQRADSIPKEQSQGGRAKVGSRGEPNWNQNWTVSSFPARTQSSQLPVLGRERCW